MTVMKCTVYSRKMDEVKAFIGEQATDPNGDGRFDSPGHSAMYVTYSMMNSKKTSCLSSSEGI